MSAVIIYRCVKCGKWSHAQRKPKFHRRGVTYLEEGDMVVSDESDPDADFYYIECGPFDSYEAVKIL